MKNIVCEGHYSADHGKYLISLSAIFTNLIRECGKLVEKDERNCKVTLEKKSAYDFRKEHAKNR